MADITSRVAECLKLPHQMPKPLPAGYAEWLLEKSWQFRHTPGGHEHDQQSHAGSGGGSEKESEGSDRGDDKPHEPSAEAMAVGGDEWNKQTAERLEKEYVEAAPKIDKIVSDAVASAAEGPPVRHELGDAPSVPDWWGAMSGSQQAYVYDDWKAHTYDSYHQSEVDSWYENSAMDDAGNQVAYEFSHGESVMWAEDAISNFFDDNEDRTIPFTEGQLLNALVVEYEGTGYNDLHKGLTISFEDDKLGQPTGWQAEQQTLPGIEPQKPGDLLTKEMREGLTKELEKAFAKEGESMLDKLEPPEYINESVTEMQEMSWGEMEDNAKFAFAKAHSDVIKNLQDEYDEYFGGSNPGGGTGKFYMPEKLDPLQAGSGSPSGYTATQIVAKHVSIERAAQVMVERGIYDNVEKARDDAKRMDSHLWEGWKGSSNGAEGQLLQKATADELGGRLNPMMVDQTQAELANIAASYTRNAPADKTYDAVKAYVRGKWETSQFLLKKAGLETVEVYRTVNIPDVAPPSVLGPGTGGDYRVTTTKTFDNESDANRYMEDRAAEYGKSYSGHISKPHNVYRVVSHHEFSDNAKAGAFMEKYMKDPANPEQHREAVTEQSSDTRMGGEFLRLPDIHIDRNGAASATTDRDVANRWDGGDGRVVLRASVPRTAVVSVPAYGINVQGEHEVVVAGTAWKGWDAWAGRAPEFERIKIGHQVVGDPRAKAA